MDNEKLYEDMKPKEKFEVLWAESGLADRPGAENLWQQMVALGFFEKPASIKHHSNHPGGLCEHSVCVAEAAMELCRTNHAFKKCHRNEVLAAALLHDYCKVGKYRDKGKGEYEYFDAGLVGHGEGSVIMAQQYIKLTAREIVAIRWHMGAYSGSQDWDTSRSFGRMSSSTKTTSTRELDMSAGNAAVYQMNTAGKSRGNTVSMLPPIPVQNPEAST